MKETGEIALRNLYMRKAVRTACKDCPDKVCGYADPADCLEVQSWFRVLSEKRSEEGR